MLKKMPKKNPKKTIHLGAYGWRHQHWSKTFYPEDLPVAAEDDWRLAYYSNEFSAVLVPADYWQAGKINDDESWLDSVHEGFRFFVECRQNILDNISLADFEAALKKLKPQLSALVFLDENSWSSETAKKPFIELANLLAIDVFDTALPSPDFVCIENDLLNLRVAKEMVEQFVAQDTAETDTLEIGTSETGTLEAVTSETGTSETGASSEATIMVNHPQLQAENLSKFRAMLEIMGY